MNPPVISGSQVTIQVTAAVSEEERQFNRRVMENLDYFLSQTPGFEEARDAVRRRLLPEDTVENRRHKYEALSGLFAEFQVPYAGGPAQSASAMLDAPFARSPYIGGTRNAARPIGFEAPYAIVAIDLEYTDKAINDALREIRHHYRKRLKSKKRIRSAKETADWLDRVRRVHELTLDKKSRQDICGIVNCSAESVRDCRRAARRLCEKGGPQEVVPHLVSGPVLARLQAVANEARQHKSNLASRRDAG